MDTGLYTPRKILSSCYKKLPCNSACAVEREIERGRHVYWENLLKILICLRLYYISFAIIVVICSCCSGSISFVVVDVVNSMCKNHNVVLVDFYLYALAINYRTLISVKAFKRRLTL